MNILLYIDPIIDPMIQPPPTIQIHILIWKTVENPNRAVSVLSPGVGMKSEDQQSRLVCSINDELLIDAGDLQSPLYYDNMGVSKNRGTPKWMVYNGKPY